jgi:diguanylate cyclase (GGDEF)-like protein
MKLIHNIRITKSIFKDLNIIMILFGLIVGIIFPFFLNVVLSVSSEIVITFKFFTFSILAGISLGIFNYSLVRTILKARFRTLIDSMNTITGYIEGGDASKCEGDKCEVFFDSDDEIGETANTFNHLIKTLGERTLLEKELKNLTFLLNEHIELKPLSESIIKNCVEKSKADAGVALMFEDDKWNFISSYGISEDEINKELLYQKGGIVDRIIEEKKVIILNSPKENPIKISGFGISFTPQNYIIFPISYHERLIGIFMFMSIHPLEENCINIFTLMSPQIGNTFQNSLLHDKIKKISVLDPLTTLYNRRFGMKRLKEEYSKAMRFKSHFSAVMIDIDFFKKVNDTYGHQAGDEVLKRLAKLLKDSIREGDVLCRYGGEEFLMMLPGSSGDDTVKMTDRIRRIIETQIIEWDGSKIEVTASFGISSCYGLEGCKTDDDESMVCSDTEMIKKADAALYRAKKEGRNRVVLSK